MNEQYPNIEREVPAWDFLVGDRPRMMYRGAITKGDPPRYSGNFLTGLAQFVRAVVREMEWEQVAKSGQRKPQMVTDPPPDLAERLAKAGAVSLYRFIDENPDCPIEGLKELLLPLFQRAVRGER